METPEPEIINAVQNSWVCGLCPSSGSIKKTRKHNVSEAGSVSVFR
jgi:hypothetical protein